VSCNLRRIRSTAMLAAAVLTVSSGIFFSSAQVPVPTSDRFSLDPAPPAAEGGAVHLVFSGAVADSARIAMWLFESIQGEYPPGFFRGDLVAFGASGPERSVRHVAEGRAHLAAASPVAAAMAYNGTGLFTKANPQLRGLFKMPYRDLVTLAVREDLGIRSFGEIVQKRIPLRMLAVRPDGGSVRGFLTAALLEAYGASLEELESWGGQVLAEDGGAEALARLAAGEADALLQQGPLFSTPRWKKTYQQIPLRVLSVPDRIIRNLAPYGFRKFERILLQGEYPGVVEDVTAVDFSDTAVLASATLPDPIAYQLVRAAVETKSEWESQYPGLAPPDSKEFGRYGVNPREMWKELGAPLHPGAERYFREKGLMP